MQLHVPTIFAALFSSFTLFVLALSFTRPTMGSGAELRLWVRSTWLLLAAFIALGSRAFLPEWLSVLAGNGLICASLFLMSQALHRFVLGHDAPRWHLALMFAGWAAIALVLGLPLRVRTLVISLFYVAQLLPMVWLIATRAWQAEAPLRTVAVTLGFTVVALLVRVGNALVRPEDFNGFFQTSLGNGLTYLASFLLPLGAGFGFVLANLERTARRLDALAAHDSMTGCLNRGAFDAVMANTLERARRTASPVSLMVLDLDDFKHINDTHGHPAGDAVLSAFAQAVRSRLRAADAFGRLGGDEFGVLLVDTDAAGARHVAETVRAAVESLDIALPGGEPVRVSASLGLATATGHTPLGQLYAEADRALYAYKQGRRVAANGPGATGAPPRPSLVA